MKYTPPPLAAWKDTLKSAKNLYALAPWRWLYDADLIGVRDDETDTTYYASILGNAGIVYGLTVYPGDNALQWHYRVYDTNAANAKRLEDETYFLMDSLNVFFEQKDQLEPEDRRPLDALHVAFPGSIAPYFRRYLPHYAPYLLDEADLRLLARLLPRITDIALRAKDDDALLGAPEGRKGEPIFVTYKDEQGVWKDEFRTPEIIEERKRFIRARPLQIARLNEYETSDMEWQASFYSLPMPIGNKHERPYFPTLFLLVDKKSGAILCADVRRYGTHQRHAHETFINAVKNVGALPETVEVEGTEAYLAFKDFARVADIRLIRKKRIRQLSKIKRTVFKTIANSNSGDSIDFTAP